MLSCLIYVVLTVAIPARLTYLDLKRGDSHLWSHYWAYFALLHLLQNITPCLTCQPFEFLYLLTHVWLYSQEYRGALLVSSKLKTLIAAYLPDGLKTISSVLAPLRLLEEGEKKE